MLLHLYRSIELSDGPLKELIESVRGLSPEDAGKVLVERYDIAKVHEEVAEEGQTEVCFYVNVCFMHVLSILLTWYYTERNFCNLSDYKI